MKKLILLAFLFFNSLFVLNVDLVKAQKVAGPPNPADFSILDRVAGKAGYNYGDIDNPYATVEMAGRFINVFLSLIGIIFTCLIIYAGYLWMTARGNEEAVKHSKDLMTNAGIGLGVVIAAYVITYFILSYLVKVYMKDSSL